MMAALPVGSNALIFAQRYETLAGRDEHGDRRLDAGLRRHRAALAGLAARARLGLDARMLAAAAPLAILRPVANSGLDPWRWAAGGIRSRRKSRPAPGSVDGAEGAASLPATAPAPMPHRPIAAADSPRPRRRRRRPTPRPSRPSTCRSPIRNGSLLPLDRRRAPDRGHRPDCPTSIVQHLMERLDEVIASDTLRAGLLPRAPHVIPQLMKTLRDEGYSSVDVASRISKDVVLTAEVVRSATSAFQRGDDEERDRPAARGDDDRHAGPAPGDRQRRPAADLRRQGRHLLGARRDPDLEGRRPQGAPVRGARDAAVGSTRSTATSPACCTTPAGPRCCARSTASRTWRSTAPQLAHPEVVPQLLQRRDALFGAIVGPWNLSAGGRRARRRRRPQRRRRRRSRRSVWRCATPTGSPRCARSRPRASGRRATVPTWATLPKAVQDCYAGLRPH